MPQPSLSDRYVWKTFRGHSRTFSFAALLLPRRVRTHVANVYLLCREIDNIADDLVLEIGEVGALRELTKLEYELELTLGGIPPSRWIWPRLHETNLRYPLRIRPIRELLQGARWDLEGRFIEDTNDLLEYAELVGGTIGEIMLPFLLDDVEAVDELVPAARSLGIAMQITNIVRDVGEDWRTRRRIYIPRMMLSSAGIDLEERVLSGEIDDAYVSLLETLMDQADERYESARPAIDALQSGARPAIHAAVRMYRQIQNEVRANGYDNLTRRAYVPFRRKLLMLASDSYSRRRGGLLREVVVTS